MNTCITENHIIFLYVPCKTFCYFCTRTESLADAPCGCDCGIMNGHLQYAVIFAVTLVLLAHTKGKLITG